MVADWDLWRSSNKYGVNGEIDGCRSDERLCALDTVNVVE